jgi:glutathione S-transferase
LPETNSRRFRVRLPETGALLTREIKNCQTCHITHWELTFQAFPNVVAHFKRMQERPSFKKLLA